LTGGDKQGAYRLHVFASPFTESCIGAIALVFVVAFVANEHVVVIITIKPFEGESSTIPIGWEFVDVILVILAFIGQSDDSVHDYSSSSFPRTSFMMDSTSTPSCSR
jgi:hypothetical protein